MTSTASTAKTGSAAVSEVPFSLRLGWGVGTLGTAILFNSYALFMLFYLVNVVGLPVALATTLIFIARIFDMLIDVPIGIMSDRTKSRWGRRRPWLLAGSFAAGLSFMLMFNIHVPDVQHQLAQSALVLAGFFFFTVGYSMFNVPYMAMPAEMTNGYDERTALMSFRVMFITLGGLFANIMGNGVVSAFGDNVSMGYSMMGVLIGIGVFFAMLACFFGTAKAKMTEHETTDYTLTEQFSLMVSNKPFFMLICAKFCQLIAVSGSAAISIFLVRNVLGFEQSAIIWFGITSTIGSLIGIPIWVRAAKILGKRTAWVTALTLFALTALTWLLAERGDGMVPYLTRGFFLGFFSAGVLLMGFAILPDTIEYDYRRTGMRREGLFASVYSFAENSASAVGPLIVGFIMAFMGYESARAGQLAAQLPEAIQSVYIGASIVPAGMMLLSCVFLFFYDLSEEKLKNAGRVSEQR